MPARTKPAPGAILSLPLGRDHILRVSYFRAQGQGNTVTDRELAFFAVGYAPGDYLSAAYRIQNVKLSLDYVSWPFPVRGKLRIKTLWGAQYTAMRTTIDAPLKPKTASDGTPVETVARGSNWFIYPTLGLGMEYFFTRNLRWELKACGFAFPGYSTLGDGEALLGYRAGQFEIFLGAKGFHFKTSPKQEAYSRATLVGGYIGLRWFP